VEVTLPSLAGMHAGIRIQGRARVVRVEHASGGNGENGFAVVCDDLNHWSLSSGQNEFDRNGELLAVRETN
jgi:hypothetical protein